MFKVFVRFTMPNDGITREREWNGLEKWGAHAILGRIHRIAKERKYDETECTLIPIGPADRWASIRYGYKCPECAKRETRTTFNKE